MLDCLQGHPVAFAQLLGLLDGLLLAEGELVDFFYEGVHVHAVGPLEEVKEHHFLHVVVVILVDHIQPRIDLLESAHQLHDVDVAGVDVEVQLPGLVEEAIEGITCPDHPAGRQGQRLHEPGQPVQLHALLVYVQHIDVPEHRLGCALQVSFHAFELLGDESELSECSFVVVSGRIEDLLVKLQRLLSLLLFILELVAGFLVSFGCQYAGIYTCLSSLAPQLLPRVYLLHQGLQHVAAGADEPLDVGLYPGQLAHHNLAVFVPS